MLRFAAICTFAAALAGAGGPALAQDSAWLETFDDWSAFAYEEDGNKVCYISSEPIKKEGKYKQRGNVYALATHRPAENIAGQISIVAGYTHKADDVVEVAIGKTSFKLFTDQDIAWTFEDKDDKAMVVAMKRGATMVVKGTSSRGTLTTDTYSLKGFTAAYNKISEACGAS